MTDWWCIRFSEPSTPGNEPTLSTSVPDMPGRASPEPAQVWLANLLTVEDKVRESRRAEVHLSVVGCHELWTHVTRQNYQA